MLGFITAVWASNLFGIIYLIVGVFVAASMAKHIDPIAWAALTTRTSKDSNRVYYIDKNGDKQSSKVDTFEKFFYFLGLLVMIIFWPAIVAIGILFKLLQYSLSDVIPRVLSKIPTFSIKLEKEKRK